MRLSAEEFLDLGSDDILSSSQKKNPLDNLNVDFSKQSAYDFLGDTDPGKAQPVKISADEFLGPDDDANNGSGFIGDTGRLLASGSVSAAQNVRELEKYANPLQPIKKAADWASEKLTGQSISGWLEDKLLGGYGIDSRLEDSREYWREGLSNEQKAAMEKDWWDDEAGWFGPAWKDPRAYWGGAVESIPEMVLTMGPSMKAATAVAKGAYQTALSKEMAAAAGKVAAKEMTEEAAKAAAQKAASEAAAKAAERAAWLVGGAAEGSLAGAATSREVRDQINALDDDVLMQSEAIQALIAQDMSLAEAKEALANDMATRAFAGTAILTGVFGGMGDRALAGILTDGVDRNIIGRVVKGGFGEGVLEELPQSAGQSIVTNLAVGEADESRGAFDGTLNEALGGLATGATTGGALGGVARPQGNRGADPGNMDDVVSAANQPPPGSMGAPMTPDEVAQYAQQREQELRSKPDLQSYEQTELEAIREAGGDVDQLADMYAINVVRDGLRDEAKASVEPLTPEDEASPIPNELIQGGREEVVDSGAVTTANSLLKNAGIPVIGSTIPLRVNGQTVQAVIQDAYDEDGKQGAILSLPDGSKISKPFSAIWLDQNADSQPQNIDSLIDQQQGRGVLDEMMGEPAQPVPQPARQSQSTQEMQQAGEQLARQSRIEDLRRIREGVKRAPEKAATDSLEPGLQQPKNAQAAPTNQVEAPAITQPAQTAPSVQEPASVRQTQAAQQTQAEIADQATAGVSPETVTATQGAEATETVQPAPILMASGKPFSTFHLAKVAAQQKQKFEGLGDYRVIGYKTGFAIEPITQQTDPPPDTGQTGIEQPAQEIQPAPKPSTPNPAVTPTQDASLTYTASGKPFKTSKSANLSAKNRKGSFEVVEVEGGFALRAVEPAAEIGPQTQLEVTATAEPDAAIAAEAKAESEYSSGLLSEKEQADLEARAKAAEQEATPKPSETTTQTIEDFGEKLEGARKDYASRMADAKEKDIAAVPLSESWPEPDYQKMLDNGVDPAVVAYARAVRDEVPAKPRRGWKLKGWVRQVETLRTVTESIVNGSIGLDRVKELAKKPEYQYVLQDVFGRADIYQALGHDKSMKGLRFYEAHYELYDGRKNVNMWVVEKTASSGFGNWPTRLADGATKEETIAKLKKFFASMKEAGKKVRFDIYMSRHDRSDVYIAKKIGKDVVRIKDGFKNVKDAREYLNNNQEELESILEQKKRIPSHRKETNSPRVGIDHRNGGDVTPEAFAEAFGFRGVQFGNYVEQGKRQQDLNEAYDGLMDLAGIIGVPAKALSLNGELGLAFGARGKGGKNAFAAHYEPGQIVINMTKKSGAGSLAHEWFHALDNYFTRERKASSTGKFATEGDATKSTRPEVAEAIEKIGQTVRKMELYHRSKQLDRTRTKPYWSTTVEMTARSFESYVIEKLRDQGLSNDYLANIASQEYWEAASALNPEAKSSYPYPEAAEIPEIRAAYDNLFDVIQSKETDAGDVMLFKRGESSGSMNQQDAQSITDEVTAGWSNAPKVNVVQSVDGLPKPIYDYAESVGALGDVRAVYWKGEMHFVADRFASRKSLEEAILHEGIGHYGVRALFGKDIEPYLERVYLAMARSDQAKEIKARYFDAKRPFDAGNKKHRMELAEELLAHMAESGKHRNLWNKIVSFIRDALRRMNFTLQINDKDLLAILREAEAVVKGGGISRMEGAPAMSRLPSTIEVDGVQRPTINSDGKPIHPTEEGVRNFWKWFKDSKALDGQGRPLVVYHGSPDVRGIFKGGFVPSMLRGSVYFASDSYAVADTYADDSRAFDFQNAEPQTVPIYISLKDPLIVDGKGQKWRETERHIKEAKDKGHDGVIIQNTRDEYNNTNTGGRLSGVYAFFKPSQAKSAIDGQLRSRIDRELIDGATGNTGAFSPDTDDIRFRRGDSDVDPEIARQVSTDRGESLVRTLFDKAVFRFQDKFNYLYKAQKQVEADRGAELTEAEDAYLAELRYHGQAGAAIEDFQREHVDPLVKQVSESGLTIDEVDKYLHARHAPEANAQLAKVNPDREDNQALSGMSNEEAERIIDQFRREGKIAGLHVIGRKVDEITKMRRDLLRSSGLETDDVINKWEETYKHYVPLYREESALARPGKGKGFSVTGKDKRRAGSNRAVTHILAHVVAQYETTAIRAEKNKVAKAMLTFAMNNPNPDLYEVDKAEYQATFDSEGLVVYRPQKEFVLADNVMVVKDDGVDRTITFNKYNDQAMKMAYALKNLGAEHSGTIANVLSRVTRYLAVINTGANPEFIISNFVRDLQTAGYNLSSTEADKMKWKIIKDVGKAWRGIRSFQKGNNSEWAQHFDEFRKAGAQTGWLEFYADISAREKKLINSVEDLRDGSSLLKVKRGLKAVWKFIEDENTAVENAIRLSAFVHARRNGVSVAKSARLAKELTVNFNRKGDYGQVMNSLYLFYNASIQGSVRLLLAAKHKKVQKLIGATVVAAMFLDVINRAIGGDDEDDKPRYDKIPDHVKERNLIIMLPSGSGDYIKIPLPWGYNVFHVMGQVMGEAMTKRGFKPTEGASRVAGSVFGAFNPIGGGTSIAQTLSPTIGDPFVQWAENKDWAGRPLRPEGSPFDIDKPMSQQYWNSVREPSRWVAEQLNSLTGGDAVRPGAIDISPEAIDLAIDFLTGGIGRFAADLTLTPAKWAQGETVESYEVPLLRKVYGKPGISTTIQEYHRNKDDVRLAQKQYEHYVDSGNAGKAQEVKQEYSAQLALVRDKQATERAISRIKKAIKRIQNLRISDDEKKTRIDDLREQERKLMMRFNKRYNDLIL